MTEDGDGFQALLERFVVRDEIDAVGETADDLEWIIPKKSHDVARLRSSVERAFACADDADGALLWEISPEVERCGWLVDVPEELWIVGVIERNNAEVFHGFENTRVT